MERTFTIELKSTYEESEKIPDFADDVGRETGMDEENTETFKLILSEAVTNAIIHGNRNDPKKKVSVSVNVTDEYVSADIQDEGKGFDPSKKKKDPLKEEHLLDIGGRGVFLIEQFSDHMEFKKNGTLLHFRIDFDDTLSK